MKKPLNPDIAFANILKGVQLTTEQIEEVSEWTAIDFPEGGLVVRTFLFRSDPSKSAEVKASILQLLRSNKKKDVVNVLVVLLYSPSNIVFSPEIRDAVRLLIESPNPSIRLNSRPVLDLIEPTETEEAEREKQRAKQRGRPDKGDGGMFD
jgi:hypothetical protein